MKNIFIVILCFTLLFLGFHPEYFERDDESGEFLVPSFTEIFGFGYELTFGTIETATSIFKGPEAFVARFKQWRVCIFGDVTVLDFIDNFTDRLPVIRELKEVVELVIAPLSDDFADLVDWIRDKIK